MRIVIRICSFLCLVSFFSLDAATQEEEYEEEEGMGDCWIYIEPVPPRSCAYLMEDGDLTCSGCDANSICTKYEWRDVDSAARQTFWNDNHFTVDYGYNPGESATGNTYNSFIDNPNSWKECGSHGGCDYYCVEVEENNVTYEKCIENGGWTEMIYDFTLQGSPCDYELE